jgi:acetyl-CoA synthetase
MGTDWPKRRNMSSLRLLGSVGRADQPRSLDLVLTRTSAAIVPDRRHVVADRDRHDHDHAAARSHAAQARFAPRCRFPAVKAEIRTQSGEARRRGGGLLALTGPWPAMLRGIYGDPERFVTQYWSKWDRATYFTATAPSATKTATSGCSGASTT